MANKESSRKQKVSKKSASESVAEPAPAEPVATETVEAPTETVEAPAEMAVPKSTRRVVNKETVDLQFANLLERFEEQTTLTRENKGHSLTIRQCQAFERDLKRLRSDFQRVAKMKKKGTRNPDSGFEKKVPVSKEIAKFAGWEAGDLHSRVDVTNALCSYIKEKGLKNKNDGREIIPDKRLAKILQYNETEHGVLTFFKIQQLIKHHFPKPSAT